jgi:flagellar hook-length control protein FliK
VSSAPQTAPDRAAAPADQASTPQPTQDTSLAAASATPRPDTAAAQPQTMTVIKASESQNGVPVLPTEQIAVTVARQIRLGNNRFEIRLDPPELGRIDVRLDLGRNGHASATLTVDRPETLSLLTRDAKTLQQALSDAGLKADTGSLNFSLRDQSAQQQMMAGQNGGQQQGRMTKANPDQQAETPAPAASTISLTASLEPGRLDLRV